MTTILTKIKYKGILFEKFKALYPRDTIFYLI